MLSPVLIILYLFIYQVNDGEYFPPKECDGGWRKNTSGQFVSTLGIIPEKLEEFGQYNRVL